MAWKILTQPRERGDLGFMDRKSHAQALLSKWMPKALTKPTIEWASLFLTLSEDFTWEQRRSINRACYSLLDHVLFGTMRTCKSLTYTSRIWKLSVGGLAMPSFPLSSGQCPSCSLASRRVVRFPPSISPHEWCN